MVIVMIVTVSVSGVVFPSPSPEEKDAGYWERLMRQEVKEALNIRQNHGVAKNIILFIGDGMGVTVNTAGRILKGQKAGRSGEEGYLAWERFPNSALLKTYLLDRQVADSAGSATAYLCGVKANYETLGVTGRVRTDDCYSSRQGANRVDSILKWAQDAGKDTGLVTTTQVTHATPAGLYAKTAQRKWMCDTLAKKEGGGKCKDIARQLVEDSPGKDMKVVLGGGRQMMGAPLEPSYTSCRRGDGRNLVEEWRQEKERQGEMTTYVTNTGELLNIDVNTTDNLIGLFAENTLPYHLDREEGSQGTPSLLQMTQAALAILSKGPRGFFLMVEAGHVDKGLHQNKAVKALEEVVQLDEAVSMALTTLNLEDTLILVTADHSHSLTLNGYPPRADHSHKLTLNEYPLRCNNIFGVSNLKDVTDELPHSTLMFSMGQGYNYTWNGTKVVRRNLTGVDTTHKEFQFPAAIPTTTWGPAHGGEDVSVHATGPMSHLFHRVHEQAYVAHVMAYSACLGPYLHDCPRPVTTPPPSPPSSPPTHHNNNHNINHTFSNQSVLEEQHSNQHNVTDHSAGGRGDTLNFTEDESHQTDDNIL
ncbi:hypothetical protein Pmani_016712 [Petrolisthes manimaculis]|uniref:Alkaline phosphatase n=1 Tax=Petrolisthes manimaculis TaxID=1843537 RepID=A0AAE1PR52_9EUCA|nr:hypothetical protein Pmani_016712 [Petrolisthes manimaculis]